MKITRSKRPNRLTLELKDETHYDASAQSIINKRFGDKFQTTGYISQTASNSFILMSPLEKLEFLETPIKTL